MKFLYPAFLFSLLAIAIPILIHLFSFRRYKTVYFSHVGFLQEIKKESRRKSRPRHILILITRILAITFLVFAFAQPYIPDPGHLQAGSNELIAIHIDNSFSMNALSKKGKLLEQARNKAAEIAQSYPAGTKFKLYTNDLQPKHQYSFSKEQFIREAAAIKPSPAVIPLSLIHNNFEIFDQHHGGAVRKTIYFISDFQKGTTDINNFDGELATTYFLPMLPSRSNNLYIDSCWVEEPAHGLNQEENIFVKIINSSNEDYRNLPLKLFLNDSLKSITTFSVNANNEIITNLKYINISKGMQLGKIEITDYPFTHDNTWHISYYVEPKIKALAIYSDNNFSREGLAYITALLKNDDYVSFETMNIQSLQISKLAGYNTIFLLNITNFSSGFLNELASAVSNGASVVLFPQTNANMANNIFLSKFKSATIIGTDSTEQRISGINFENRFFDNVFREKKENAILPQVDYHIKFNKNTRTDETNLLWFQNGDKALSVAPYDNGKVWVFAFPLEKSNEAFARDILFIPSIYNIVIKSLPIQQISYTIGRERTILLSKSMNVKVGSTIEIEDMKSGGSFIPGLIITKHGSRLEINNMIKTAGHYLVKKEDKELTSLAYNYDRNESELTYFNKEELVKNINSAKLKNASVISNTDRNFSEIFEDIDKEKQLWKYCIILSLIFILAEVIISRFMNN